MRRPLSLIKLKERSVLAARVLTVKKRRAERIEMTMLRCGGYVVLVSLKVFVDTIWYHSVRLGLFQGC